MVMRSKKDKALTQGDNGVILMQQTSLFDNILDDPSFDYAKETNIKYGDIYVLGNHRLMCGDSTKLDDIKTLLAGANPDMIFTDPPYNVAFNGRSGKFDVIINDDITPEEFEVFITTVINNIKTINPKYTYIWCNWKFYGILQSKIDFNACIVWAKNVFGMGQGYRHQHEFCLFKGIVDDNIKNESDLWKVAKDVNYIHPTQKPTLLCHRALKNHKDAKIVLDMFGGSGSTLIACEQLERNCYMMELDEKYAQTIINRWRVLTKGNVIKL